MADNEFEGRVRDLEWRVRVIEEWRAAQLASSQRMPTIWLTVIMATTGIAALLLQLFLAGWSP
jgi:hypothetical protein